MRPLVVVDSRRLLRAVALGLVAFLFVGGGVGFVVAQGEDSPHALQVPAPRPGDRAVYAVQKSLLPDLALGDGGDILLDEVVYEWLPETTILDATSAPRLVQPLRSTYVFMKGNAGETRYVVESRFDASTGLAVSAGYDGTGVRQQPIVPGQVIGSIGGGIDQMVQPPSDVYYAGDVYTGLRLPCGQRGPLHGAEPNGTAILGRCGWPTLAEPEFEPDGWDSVRGRQAYHYEGIEDGRLGVWYETGSPFPLRVRTSMLEIVDPGWTVGRLFTLDRTAWAAGSGGYTVPAGPTPPGEPLPLVPLRPWMLDDSGMETLLSLETAFVEAEAAPRARGSTGLAGTSQQPSVREWMQYHPNAYLVGAHYWEFGDEYGEQHPNWGLVWSDGTDLLTKLVAYDAAVGDQVVFLPSAAGRRITVMDWNAYTTEEAERAYLEAVPDRAHVPSRIPAGAAAAERFLQDTALEGPVNYYGFRLLCNDAACTGVEALLWVGQTTYSETTGATGSTTNQEQIRFLADGTADLRHRRIESKPPLLGLGEPSSAEEPPAPAAVATGGVWELPTTARAATGVSVVALLAAALYYFWPSLKGLPLVGLFSRIRDDKVLDHPQRARLLDAIQADPGVHFQELSRRLAVGHGTLEHHVRKLVAADLVVVRRSTGYTCYFPRATDRRMMDAAPMLRSGGSRAVLQAVAAKPGTSSRDLAVHLGLAPSTVSYHLKRLETAGLVSPDPKAGVRLTPLGEQAQGAA